MPGLEVLQAVAGSACRAGRVVRIVARDGMEEDRVVLDRARHRTDVIERMGQREDAVEADRAVGRLQPDDAAAGRGIAHRAAGVGAERRRRQARGQRRARAARRAAGMAVAVPGIARRRPGQVERRPAGRELVQRGLAEQHRARVVELAHDERVGCGAMVLPDLGMAGRRHAFDVEDVLRGIGHAVHRPAPLALGDLGLGGLCLRQRLVGGHGEEGVVVRVDRGDPVEQRARPFHRRKLFRAQQRCAFGNGEPGEVGHFFCSNAAGLNTGAGEAVGTWPFGGSPTGLKPALGRGLHAIGKQLQRLRKPGLLGQKAGGLGNCLHASLMLSPSHSGAARSAEPGIQIQTPFPVAGFRVRAHSASKTRVERAYGRAPE